MKKSGKRNGRRKYKGGKMDKKGSERWNRQGGNDDEKAEDEKRETGCLRGCGNASQGEERPTHREPDSKPLSSHKYGIGGWIPFCCLH